jgi:hypothetical protein
MEFSPETIFISYSRSDGRDFAEKFERRLEEEAGIHAWRDLKSVEGGEDIRPQVLRAIEKVKHFGRVRAWWAGRSAPSSPTRP